MSNKTKDHILLLFDRPLEPVFFPKGDTRTVFDIPDEYLTDRLQPLKDEIIGDVSNRFGEVEHVIIKKVTIPDLTVPLSLGRYENFSLFIPSHREMASVLIDVFMKPKSLEDFLSISVYIRDRANLFMFFYALSVALLHRPDTRDLPLPSFAEVFPEKYTDAAVFNRAKEEANIVLDEQKRLPIEIPRDYTASDLDEEHRVAYFREDLGINLHHWHWHLVYPFSAATEIVVKNRRGELFYYMHQQVLARYDFERFSNHLARTKRLMSFRDPIPEGYFPKMDSLVSSRVWPARSANTILSDVNREIDQLKLDIQDLERWRDRIFQAIHTGSVLDANGRTKILDEIEGIDMLGNMMESSILSVNSFLYGDLHNLGHIAIGMAHDPDHRHLETYGVMGDSATAMRDPVFYRWHAFINDIFLEHKNLLPRYRTDQLEFNGVEITSAEINVENQPKNVLQTMWQKSDVDMSRGLDFTPRGNVFTRFTHLQHIPFSYKIKVENSGPRRQGTCRIFLAPKFDERGLTFFFRDQKNLFIEMDKFVVTLEPNTNTIERKSRESTVIIPFEMTFRNLEAGRPGAGAALEEFNFCGCGWPEHMLVPKGTAAGLPCQLFVMISDYEGDRVGVDPKAGKCQKSATSFCGLRDNLYPDKRSMGYPFDRMPRTGVNYLSQFITSNMIVTDVTIRHSDVTIIPKEVGKNEVPRG